MALDVRVHRSGVPWSSDAAMALRHGVQDLEDHLLGLGLAGALELRVRSTGGTGDIHAVLHLGDDRLDANAEDPDLAYGLTQALERLRSLASPQRVLVDDGRGPRLHADAPWEDLLATVVATATHWVTRAVDHGDLPAGVVDPRDLADEALADVLDSKDRDMRAVRERLRAHLDQRIARAAQEQGDLQLDDPGDRSLGDDGWDYRQPDEVPPRNTELLDPAANLADETRRR
ncbi:MAG: hypothetical protein ABMA64_36725 [Myxococcota bacterium]